MNLLSLLLDLFIPRECHICSRRLLDNEDFVCHGCMDHLPVAGYDKYWSNKSAPNSDLNPMEQRFAGQLPLVHAIAPFLYTRDSSLASLIHDFKYRGFSRLAKTMGREGAALVKDSGFFTGIDLILYVPLHRRKKWKRGYNQAEMIAEGISEVTGLPVGHNLKAPKPHRTQTSLNAARRIENTRDIFSVRDAYELQGKHILLADDICTTGATLLSAGETLVRAVGPSVKLSLFTLGVV